MDNMFSVKALTAAVLVAGGSSAWALDPAPVEMGPVSFTPTLKVSEAYDDNIRALGGGLDESSWITTVRPTFEMALKDRLNVYKLTYAAEANTYHSSKSDNHVNHFVDLDTHLEFNDRNRLDINAGYDEIEQVVDTQAGAGQNDLFHKYNVGGVYGFGAESSTMQLELGANQEWLRYDNDQLVAGRTDGRLVNANRERDTTSVHATAFYRVAPKTRALLEVRHRDFDYQMTGSTLSNEAVSYLAGVTWDATAKTTGTAKFGYTTKDFDDSSRDEANKSVWEVGVTWEPLTYSSFTLNTSRDFDEGYEGAEDAIDVARVSITWNHSWSDRLSSNVGYTYTEKEYQYTNSLESRDDDNDLYRVGLIWKAQRWMDVGLNYSYEDADSSSPMKTQTYNRNVVSLSVNMSL